MACSKFNAGELESLGYDDINVLPLVLNFDNLASAPDPKTLKRFNDGKVNVLFVGRCAPNKKIEDALRSFYFFHRFVEPESR